MELRDFVRQNYLPSSYKAFLSVGCQIGVSTDTIFETRHSLDFKLNSDFVIHNHDDFIIRNQEKVLVKNERVFCNLIETRLCNRNQCEIKVLKKESNLHMEILQ